jgi:hypothetical protein
LRPERLANILTALNSRLGEKNQACQSEGPAFQREASEAEERLTRLYRSIEEGIVEFDDLLRDRVTALKAERERTKSALERARVQMGTAIVIDVEKIDAFARLFTEKLENGDIKARKGYIRSIVSAVEVDNKTIRIIGQNTAIQAAVAGKPEAADRVSGFVRKWRTREDSNVWPPPSEGGFPRLFVQAV